MKLGDFNFEGPLNTVDQLREEPGIYVVLSIRPGSPDAILDVGESGWNFPAGQGVRSRLRVHSRRQCWEEHRLNGAIAFAVLYEKDGEKRLRIEEKLRRLYRPPCGTDPWHFVH